jgi:predicted CXXCH cytochrome family protein
LEDVFVVLTGNDRVDERGRHQVVSHVEQMRSSRCYVGSEQALGCTSCHDPHFEPEPEARDAWYRDQCARCHADQPCSLGLEEQTAPPADGSCIHCHMPSLGGSDVPHTAQTDHRIIRDHRRGADASPSPQPGEPLAVFDGAELGYRRGRWPARGGYPK